VEIEIQRLGAKERTRFDIENRRWMMGRLKFNGLEAKSELKY